MYVLELVGEHDAFAAYEASSVAAGVHRVAPGIAKATMIQSAVSHLGFTRRALFEVDETRSHIDAITTAVRTTPLDRRGTVAVRARGIRGGRIDTRAVERAVGQVLVDQNFDIDLEAPNHELHVIVVGDRAYIGWLVAASEASFSARRPTDRPFFQPGSMAPRLARALVMIAGARPGVSILDPMCGTGGVIIEAALVGARTYGFDIQAQMVAGTQRNCAAYASGADVTVGSADATRLPFRDEAFDSVVFDAPYGRQSRIATARGDLLTDAFGEARRVARQAVVVSDRQCDDTIRDAGWQIRAAFERRVHRSLTRYIYHLVEA